MKNTVTGRLALGIVGLLGVALLAGCSSPGSTSTTTGPSTAGPSTTSAASSSATSSGPSGNLSIVVSSNGPSDAAFKAVTDAFNQKYPGMHAVVTPVANDAYAATKAAQLAAGEADIVVGGPFRDLPSYADAAQNADMLLAQAGGYLDLTSQPWLSKYTPSIIDSVKMGGKVYSVPTGLSYATGVYYNKKIFADNNLQIPTTWAELQNVISVLQGKGITPFGMGGKDIWPVGLVMNGVAGGLYPTAADKQKAIDGLWGKTVDLSAGTPLTVLERTQTIMNATVKNFAGAGYDEIPAAFAKGDFAMLPDGTWNHTTILTAVGSSFDVGMFPLPAGDDAAANKYLNGKVELSLAVNAKSKNTAGALAWLEFFSDPANYAQFVTTAGFAPSQPNIKTDAFLDSISAYTASFEPMWESLWIANPKAGQDATYPFNYPALKPLGSSDPAAAAKAAQQAWQA